MTKVAETPIEFAEKYLAECGGARPGVCWTLAWNIRDLFGGHILEGSFQSESGRIPHSWNELPDGRWFDGSAGMFDGGPPRFIGRHAARYGPRVAPDPKV